MVLIQDYFPVKEITFKAFKLLDPRTRKVKNSTFLFRKFLLERFTQAYDIENHEEIMDEFDMYSELKDEELPIKDKKFISKYNEFDVESY